MAQTTETRVRPLWHDQNQTPRRKAISPAPRVRRILLTTSLLMVALAAGTGLLTWLMGQPKVHFVSCWVTKFRDPTIASNTAADRDRLAIQRSGYFVKTDVASMPVHSRFLMQQQLDAVADETASESVVLYVGTYATVNKQGRIVLLSSDFEVGRPESGLPLAVVLQSLARSLTKHKLLVLDIFAPCLRPGLDVAATSVAAALGKELAAVPDANRLVLCSCSPGQVALESESLQRTLFGYYFEQALQGAADGYNPNNNRDGRVSVREAAAMLRARVDQWAMHNRSLRQTPRLLGTADDFELTVCKTCPVGPLATSTIAQYPVWLLEGWKLRDRWQQGHFDRLNPRVFQVLQASLLRIEHKWRFGGNEARLQLECHEKIKDLQQLAKLSEQQLAGPDATSLAAVFASGHEVDSKAVTAVSKVLNTMKAVAHGKPADRQAVFQKQLADFDKQAKEVANVDVALALLQAAVASDPLTPSYLRTLVDLLRHRQISDQWIETRVLDRLAKQAAEKPPQLWSTRRATQLLRIVQRREQAFCHYETMPWMNRLLETTAQACHDAEVYYWAPRYVASTLVDHTLSSAADNCDRGLAHQTILIDAFLVYDRALRDLPWNARYVNCYPATAADWKSAIDATIHLAESLESATSSIPLSREKPHDSSASSLARPLEIAVPHQQLDAIRQASSNAMEALRVLQQPFESQAIRKLIGRCQNEDVRPKILTEMDAVLATPFLTSADRKTIWTARATLAHRWNESMMQRDYRQQMAGRRTTELAGYDPDVAMRAEDGFANLRQSVSLDMVRLAGISVPQKLAQTVGDDQGRLSPAQVVGMSRIRTVTLRELIDDAKSTARQERLCSIFPPLKPLPLLDTPSTNPTVQRIASRRGQLWSWLADTYRYETLDGPDPEFYAKLAAQYAPYSHNPATPSLQTHGPARLQAAGTTDASARCEVSWSATALADKHKPVAIDILNPAARWLAVSCNRGSTGNQPSSPLCLSVSLAPDARFTGEPPLGFLVRWRIAGRDFHRKVKVPALADQCYLSILLSGHAKPPLANDSNAKGPLHTIEHVLLRPHTAPESLYLFVQNHGAMPRKVIVQLNSGATSKPLEIPAGECVGVQFPPPTASPSGNGKVGNSETGNAAHLPELRGPLQVTLLDAASRRKLCDKAFPIQLMEPRQYVAVQKARFFPSNETKNRLEIELRQLGDIPGPACSVSLNVSAKEVPGLLGLGDGVLKGILPANGKPLTLFASDLHLTDSARDQGQFSIAVDGVPRTFVFDTTFARRGDPTTPVESIRPTLQLSAPHKGRSGGKFVVQVETNYAPSDAAIEIQIGRQLSTGQLSWERTTELPSARHSRIGFSPAGKGGALLFDASVMDWNVAIDTAGLVGHRLLQVRLVASDQRELAVARQEVVFGNRPPQGVQFVDLPSEAWNGQPLQLTATARQSLPNVSRVVFFLGKPANNAIPKAAVTAEATAADATAQTWTAQLPVNTMKKGKANVSVQFTNAAGLSSYATSGIKLTDVEIGGSLIRGTAVEGSIPQRGLKVTLKDGKGMEQGKATTAADGSFTFENLKPGKYEVSTSKPTSGRHGSVNVTVQDNTTTQTTIELWL